MKTTSFKLSVIVITSLALFGCVSSAPELNEAVTVSLPRAPLAPTLEEMRTAPSIVVMEPRAGQNVHPSFATLAQQEVQRVMTNSGNDVIDRTLSGQAKAELEYAELNGVYRTTGPKVADIAIMGELSRVTWSSSFTEREQYKDRNDDWQTRPAYCTYSGNAEITLRAFSLPDMIPLGNYELTGRESYRDESVSSRECQRESDNIGTLMGQAVRKAISDNSHQILDDLARPFYVTERRQVGTAPRSALFHINAGLGQGAERNLSVYFYRVQENTNDFTGETRREEIKVAEGRVTDNIDQNGSYVVVSGNEMNNIMAGDIARFVRNTCPRGQQRVLGICMSDSFVN